MTDYIPLPIQIKIFCHLPVKSIVRFRSVSKEWKSLIDSSEFNSDFILGQVQRPRFLLRAYRGNVIADGEKGEYCWVVEDDDDIFLQNKISLSYPPSVNRLLNKNGLEFNGLEFIGSSHGLLCFSGCYVCENNCFSRYVIWNPSIRKSLAIDALYYKDVVQVGFGVCPNSLDPKIVRISEYYVPYYYNIEQKLESTWVWRVDVFTLSEGVWRSPLTKLPNKWSAISLFVSQIPVIINGYIYWSASVDYLGECNMIISFNLATEEFTKNKLPDELAHLRRDIFNKVKIFNLRGSLGVVHSGYAPQSTYTDRKDVHEVWLMDHVSKSFIKLYTFTLPYRWKVVGFRDNDDRLIIEKIVDFKYVEERGVHQYEAELVAYEPYSKQLNKLGINFGRCSYITYANGDNKFQDDEVWSSSFTCYTESLLLLDQSNTINDDEGDALMHTLPDFEITARNT
ncbi:putative F-box protein At1g32420 [Rutidosis leptorrhynchoides]|uniref:putative F-box protein At1g32420 n=1 Tax=Rutidosis leptorrhynchoides TaxID=125765 RepID=UPI003A9A0D6B